MIGSGCLLCVLGEWGSGLCAESGHQLCVLGRVSALCAREWVSVLCAGGDIYRQLYVLCGK